MKSYQQNCCCSSTPPGRVSTPQGCKSSRVLVGRMEKLPCSFWVDTAFVLTVFLASAVGSSFNRGEIMLGCCCAAGLGEEGFLPCGWLEAAGGLVLDVVEVKQEVVVVCVGVGGSVCGLAQGSLCSKCLKWLCKSPGQVWEEEACPRKMGILRRCSPGSDICGGGSAFLPP